LNGGCSRVQWRLVLFDVQRAYKKALEESYWTLISLVDVILWALLSTADRA
jgi:hypothetical protein